MDDEGDVSALKSQLSQMRIMWVHELERRRQQEEMLEAKLNEIKEFVADTEKREKREMEVLWRRVKAAATWMTYLKSKAKIMAVPHLAHTSCGIRHQEGVGFVDKHGAPLADWSKVVDLSLFESLDEEKKPQPRKNQGLFDEYDGAYIGDIIKSVLLVTDVMEALVKRVIIAETETATEKEKVNLGQEEIRKKTLQVEKMSARVEEMEKLASGTDEMLKEMRQKIEDMAEETSRQRQRAAENEQELFRVRQDVESLRSSISGLVSVRQTLISSEKQFQTMEKLFERLIASAAHLERMIIEKDSQIRGLEADKDRLTALLDLKEAQLVAMNEQCKIMATKPL
ncbi:hypothetical protein EJ110_NYTH04591 [Nymphaea thermarum]|nr:hypothetical protein EJ110_NYTH04591 [Nymphaea thermarum]